MSIKRQALITTIATTLLLFRNRRYDRGKFTDARREINKRQTALNSLSPRDPL